MRNWFKTRDDTLWLKPDEVGEEEARFIKSALRLRRGQAVLDAPCGAGRISFHLARAGCSVTGIDLRKIFITRARRRFRNAGLSGNFAAMDLRKLDFEYEFHGIFNWHGSFGYFPDEENENVVSLYARALRPGGRLLIDQPNRDYLFRHFIAEHRSGRILVCNRWDTRTQRIISRRSVDGKVDPRNSSTIRLYTPMQMRKLMARHGLMVERVYGSYRGDPSRKSSRRLIVVATKE